MGALEKEMLGIDEEELALPGEWDRVGGGPADPQDTAPSPSPWERLVRHSLGLVPKITLPSRGKMIAEARTGAPCSCL